MKRYRVALHGGAVHDFDAVDDQQATYLAKDCNGIWNLYEVLGPFELRTVDCSKMDNLWRVEIRSQHPGKPWRYASLEDVQAMARVLHGRDATVKTDDTAEEGVFLMALPSTLERIVRHQGFLELPMYINELRMQLEVSAQ